MIRAEDLIEEDAISPNILKRLRDEGRALSRIIRSSYADIGSERAAQGYRSPYWNFITVAKQGGDFQTITEALIAIEDNSMLMRYVIFLYPGIYDEEVVMKPYVALVGLDRDICIIQSIDYQNLLALDDHCSINEIQAINERNAAEDIAAIYGSGLDDVLVDSCIGRVHGGSSVVVASAIHTDLSARIRVLGSEFYANHDNAGGFVIAGNFLSNEHLGDVELRYCYFEIEEGAVADGFGLNASQTTGADGELLAHACRIVVDNDAANHRGVNVVTTSTGHSYVYLVNTDVEHRSAGGGGEDLRVLGANARIYVRSVRYSTWSATTSGQILALAGDRPRLTCLHNATDFDLTQAGGVWENDPFGLLNIDLPCTSDVKIDAVIMWSSDTLRDNSFRARMLVDGVLVLAGVGYQGEPNINSQMIYSLTTCATLGTGAHTVQLQVARNIVGDTVTIKTRQFNALSAPWP